MTQKEAIALIQNGNIHSASTWVDLGAGRGTFTYALAEIIGPKGKVYAIDQQAFDYPRASHGAQIIAKTEDFTQGINLEDLDGILMANSLHYVKDKVAFLSKILKSLKKGGSFILIEYDTESGNNWVPFPISLGSFKKLAKEVGLSEPIEIGRRESRYGNGGIYAALCRTTDGL